MARGDARVLHLVVAGRFESDRIRARRRLCDCTERAGHRRTVGAAAQERAGARPFGAGGHAGAERGAECRRKLRDTLPLVLLVAHLPIRLYRRTSILQPDEMPCLHPLVLAEDGFRTGDHVKVHVVVERLRRDRAARLRMRIDDVARSTEHHCIAGCLVDDVAHADSIDGEHDRVRALVDNRQREVAADHIEQRMTALQVNLDRAPAEPVDIVRRRSRANPCRMSLHGELDWPRRKDRSRSGRARRGNAESRPRQRVALHGPVPCEAMRHRVENGS